MYTWDDDTEDNTTMPTTIRGQGYEHLGETKNNCLL